MTPPDEVTMALVKILMIEEGLIPIDFQTQAIHCFNYSIFCQNLGKSLSDPANKKRRRKFRKLWRACMKHDIEIMLQTRGKPAVDNPEIFRTIRHDVEVRYGLGKASRNANHIRFIAVVSFLLEKALNVTGKGVTE
jgi:hypothetical protein